MRLIPGGDPLIEEKLTRTRGRDGAKVIAPTFENGLLILREDLNWEAYTDPHSGTVERLIRFNSLRQAVEVRSPPWEQVDPTYDATGDADWRDWTDRDFYYLRAWFRLEERFRLKYDREDVREILTAAAHQNSHHPVQNYLKALTWDGVSRLDSWLAKVFGCEQTDYAARVGRWFLVSMVARVMSPGCQVDHMLVLEGPQGYGKSTALRELASDAWFSDTHLDLASKDAYQALEGKWLIELAELASLSRAAMDRTKSFVTERTSRYRPPYARSEVIVPRQCVFVGTTNDAAYLTDATGNRRFWPVRACRLVAPGTVSVLRDQLWAEAREAFDAGERWHPTQDEARTVLVPEQDARQLADPWEALVSDWQGMRTETTAEHVLAEAIGMPVDRQTSGEVRRVARVLQALGWLPRRTKLGRFWVKNLSQSPERQAELLKIQAPNARPTVLSDDAY